MADGSDLQVRFGADTAGVRTGAEQVKTELGGLRGSVQTLEDAFLVLGGAASGSFREIRTGAIEAHEQVKGLSESMIEFREMITGIGEALIAAFAVEQLIEFARKMGEAGEKIEHTATALGMTTDEVQQMQAMANATGMSLDTATGAVTRLERALGMAHTGTNKQSEAFKQLGVDINVARTPAELFQATIAGFAEMPPSLEKSQIAAALFGRNLASVAPLIGLTAEQMANIAEQTDKYGLVNEDAVAKSAALGRAFNENKNASQGLANVMAQEFAPAFTVLVQGVNDLAAAFIHSYREGGVAKVLLDSLVVTVKVVAEAVALAGAMFLDLWHAGVAAIEALMGPVMTLGYVIRDALSGNIAQAAKDAQAGFRATGQVVRDELAKIAETNKGFADFSKKLWNPPKAHGESTPPIRSTGDGYGDGKEKKQKKAPEEDAISKLREQFEEQENAHRDMITDMTADELAFWQTVRDGADFATLNQKQQAQVRLTIGRLEHQESMILLRDQMAQARDAASAQIGAVKDAAAQRKAVLDQQVADIEAAQKRGELSQSQAHARVAALYREEQQTAVQAANAIYQARVQADEFIKQHSQQATNEYKQAQKDEVAAANDRNRQIVAANDNANKQIQQRNRQTLDQLRQQWHGYIDGTVQAMGNGIKGMINGTQTFGRVIKSIGESILDTFIGIAERMVENWIINLIVGQAAQQTSAIAQITSAAGVAGANGVASMAGAPFPIDLGAPAFGASMAETAMAFSAFSAEGGWGQVPVDNAPTFLHKNEMVLPATLANPLRSALSGQTLGGPTSTSGDTHISLTHAPVIGGGASVDVIKHLDANKLEFAKLLKSMGRAGHFKAA